MAKGRDNSNYRFGCICKVHCDKYPCFKGQDNLDSPLATTCQDFKQKGDWKKIESIFYMKNRKLYREVILKSMWDHIDIEIDKPRLYNFILLGVKHNDQEAIFIKQKFDNAKRKFWEIKRAIRRKQEQEEEELIKKLEKEGKL